MTAGISSGIVQGAIDPWYLRGTNGLSTNDAVWFEEFPISRPVIGTAYVLSGVRWRTSRARWLHGARNAKPSANSSNCTRAFA